MKTTFTDLLVAFLEARDELQAVKGQGYTPSSEAVYERFRAAEDALNDFVNRRVR